MFAVAVFINSLVCCLDVTGGEIWYSLLNSIGLTVLLLLLLSLLLIAGNALFTKRGRKDLIRDMKRSEPAKIKKMKYEGDNYYKDAIKNGFMMGVGFCIFNSRFGNDDNLSRSIYSHGSADENSTDGFWGSDSGDGGDCGDCGDGNDCSDCGVI